MMDNTKQSKHTQSEDDRQQTGQALDAPHAPSRNPDTIRRLQEMLRELEEKYTDWTQW
ncbi:MAG: hypothetical protein IKF39_02550 [Oscillospiraceae bacterium]|nr:hypothetical protein [Oscillospiraceae bacterium]